MQVVHNEHYVVVHKDGRTREYDTAIEALISECKLYAGYTDRAVGRGIRGGLLPKEMEASLGITKSHVSKVKHDIREMPNIWLIKLHVWSGMPLRDIEALAGVESDVQPYMKP